MGIDKQKMDNDIIFLILQYNNVDVTINCIHSIWGLKNQCKIRIVVVDNCSPDGAGRAILEHMRNICLETSLAESMFLFKHESGCEIDVICRPVNEGFSMGNNYGYRYIIEKYSPRFLIVANSDVEFIQENFIELIEEEYKKTMFDILGPDIWAPYKEVHQNPLSLDIPTVKEVSRTIFLNRLCLCCFPLVYPILNKYMQRTSDSCNLYVARAENVCLQGSCLIYSSKYIKFRGQISEKKQKVIARTLFYPETNLYYEEFLQTLWCRNNGCKMVYTPDIRVNHLEGQSTNTVSSSEKEKIIFRMKNILASAQIYKKELSGDL